MQKARQLSDAGDNQLSVLCLGRTKYDEALKWQLDLVEWRREGAIGDTLILTEHEPVVTLGRASEPEDTPDPRVLARHGIAVCEASRGGKATYHGPGQLVGYPIVDLRARGEDCTGGVRAPALHVDLRAGGGDLHRYVGDLEAALIGALARLGIEAQSRPGLRGVWVGSRKIASIGVAVRRWVAYHGFALNVDCDLEPFRLFAPCGIKDLEMTTVAEVLGREIDWNLLEAGVVEELVAQLGYEATAPHPIPLSQMLVPSIYGERGNGKRQQPVALHR